MLLRYLFQHHSDDFRNKIQHFTNKDNEEYRLAMNRLKREYGRPCIIADACKRKLKTAKAVKLNNLEGLRRFSDLTEKTLITLKRLNLII